MIESSLTFYQVLKDKDVVEKIIYAKNFVNMVSQEGFCLRSFKEIDLEDRFSLLSPINNEVIYCFKSVIYKKVVVLFFLNPISKSFYLVFQANYFISAVFSFSEGILLYQTRRPDFYSEAINYLINIFDDNIDKQKKWKGYYNFSLEKYLLNGYPRPHHYFYDRLPEILTITRKTDIPLVTLGSEAFIGSEIFEVDRELYFRNESTLNDYKDFRDIVVIHAANETKIEPIEKINKIRSIFPSIGNPLIKKNDREVWIWIGLCSEKRGVQNIVDIVCSFINFIATEFKDFIVKFVFDGMTRTVGSKKESFLKEYCELELNHLQEIKKRNKNLNYISLIGAEAVDKISIGSQTNFFFTNALTDSMWTAGFFEIPGLAYYSSRALIDAHVHNNTIFLPDSCLEIIPSNINWSQDSLIINENKFLDFLSLIDFNKII